MDRKKFWLIPNMGYWIGVTGYFSGFLMILTALLRYRSWSNRSILGYWSEIHFSLILFFIFLFLLFLLRTWRESFALDTKRTHFLRNRLLFGLALLAWGGSFFISSLDDRQAGGRIFDFVFFGSTYPVAIFLEWVALDFLLVAGILSMRSLIHRCWNVETRQAIRANNALVLITTIAFMVLLFEGSFRFNNVFNPTTQGFPTKSSELWTRKFVQYNNLGYRDREHMVEKDKRTLRILLIGDSFTFGAGIKNPENRFGNLLENGLNSSSSNVQYEVINAGMRDTHTLHHIDALNRLLVYDPDYVLLIYVFNDINHVQKESRSVITDMHSPLGRIHPLRLLVKNSHFFEQIFIRLRKMFYLFQANQFEADAYSKPKLLDKHLAALYRLFKNCQKRGIPARLIPFDITVQLHPKFAQRYRTFVEKLGARGILTWSLSTTFKGHSFKDLVVNGLDSHPNELANRLIADSMLQLFKTKLSM